MAPRAALLALVDSIPSGSGERASRNIRLAREAIPASVALLQNVSVTGDTNFFAATPAPVGMLDERTSAVFTQAATRVVNDEIVPAVRHLMALLELQLRSESLRYSTELRGNTLAYKMGSHELMRLRAHACRTRVARFDLSKFHTAVADERLTADERTGLQASTLAEHQPLKSARDDRQRRLSRAIFAQSRDADGAGCHRHHQP